MIVAVVQKLLDIVFARKSELDEVRVDFCLIALLVADRHSTAVLGGVRYQDEEL